MGINNTVLQMLSEDSKRGRVLGVNTSCNWGIMAVVIMLFGFLAKSIGSEKVLILIGLMTILSGLLYIWSVKAQRKDLDTLYKEREVEPGHEPI
jgi:uncharacterized membrane protein YfcA